MKIINQEPHANLHKQIYECECKPWSRGVDYCENCQSTVVDFMNKHGAGILCRDEEIELMLKSSIKLAKENEVLRARLESKIKRVEKLKADAKDFINRLKKKMIIYDVYLDGLQLREHEKNRIIDNCSPNTRKVTK